MREPPKKPDMKRNSKDLPDQFRLDATVIFSILLLLFPVSASVLCIAPDHIAVEDINAGCCASSGIHDRGEKQRDSGFAANEDCRNCTDLLLPTNKQAAVLESFAKIVPNLLSHAYLRNHFQADISSFPHRSGTLRTNTTPISITASAPVRC
jgi:hypothetical protein